MNLVCKTSDGQYVLLIVSEDTRVDFQGTASVLKVSNLQPLCFASISSDRKANSESSETGRFT